MNVAAIVTPSGSGHPIWQALIGYRIGPEEAELPFAARLARENGWTIGFADRVIDEYKRFCFLATFRNGMTPSDAVDQAWHLHLTYTHDYWERFCPDILCRPLHHRPTNGGAAEGHRFFDQYAQTLHAYEKAFGEAPPEDIWPDAARRLIDDPKARRVHPREALILPWRYLRILLLLTAMISIMIAWTTLAP